MAMTLDKWDERFIEVASLVASWSKDPSTKVGAVLVDPGRKRIVSTGYNGFPRLLVDDNLQDRERKYSRVIHAEMNALLHAREPVDGFTIYVTPLMVCDRCAVHLIQAGIKRVVYQLPQHDTETLPQWVQSGAKALDYFNEAGVLFEGLRG